eukprot:8420948-Lingulodinium_polyedra.AAC.1
MTAAPRCTGGPGGAGKVSIATASPNRWAAPAQSSGISKLAAPIGSADALASQRAARAHGCP